MDRGVRAAEVDRGVRVREVDFGDRVDPVARFGVGVGVGQCWCC